MSALVVQKTIIGAKRIIGHARQERHREASMPITRGKEAGTGLSLVPNGQIKQRRDHAHMIQP